LAATARFAAGSTAATAAAASGHAAG